MTSIRLKYVQAWVDRDGRVHRYFRRPGFPRVRLPGLPGSAEFNRAYEAALEGPHLPIGGKRSRPGSLSAAIAGYYTSLEFRSLATGTQAMRRAILERFRAAHGDKPIALLPVKFIAHVLSTMKPFAARNWLKAIRHLMQFCVAQEMCAADPTQGIKLPRAKTDGIHSWSEGEIAMFEATHPVGTKPRLSLALLLYTAQRRGDVLRMGRQHIRDGVLTVRQDKTGTTLAIPVHSDLRAVLDATPGGNLTFLVGKRGKPFTPNAFSKWFRDQCDAAGLPETCSAHGLRKAACRRLAEAGCSANEIAAISGHASLREVERYTKAVDQERMARNAMARTKNESATVKLRQV
jgi:integrase